MSNIYPFRRTTWKPRSWQLTQQANLDWRGTAYPRKASWRVSFRRLRNRGLITIVVMAGLVSALHYAFAPATTDRHIEFRDGNRITKMVTPPNATAIDGDSLHVSNQKVRLLGIDAPELIQTCRDEHGREWTCGREAQARLNALLSRGTVKCVSRSKDLYGRTLGICSAGPIDDVGETMVRTGYAVDFMGGRYRAAEAEARAEKRGIWRGSFEAPEEWRRLNPRSR